MNVTVSGGIFRYSKGGFPISGLITRACNNCNHPYFRVYYFLVHFNHYPPGAEEAKGKRTKSAGLALATGEALLARQHTVAEFLSMWISYLIRRLGLGTRILSKILVNLDLV